MVQAFRFDGRGVTHRARVLARPKLSRETEAGRRLYWGFGTAIHGGSPVRRLDDVNTANISVLDHHGELFALWEAGSGSVLDRESLAWRGFNVWGTPVTVPRLTPEWLRRRWQGSLESCEHGRSVLRRKRCERLCQVVFRVF